MRVRKDRSHAEAQPGLVTFIELRLDHEGKGEGELSIATRIVAGADGGVIHLEDWAAQPVQLTKVTRH